jgi:hypothetical protein
MLTLQLLTAFWSAGSSSNFLANTAILALGLHILAFSIRRRVRVCFIWGLSRVEVNSEFVFFCHRCDKSWKRVLQWRRLTYAVHVLTLQCSTPSSDVTDYAL